MSGRKGSEMLEQMRYGYARAARRPSGEMLVDLRRRRRWFAEDDGESGQDQDNSGGSGKYTPTDLSEAQKIIQALEKRIGEREATIDELKAQFSTTSDRLSAIERDRKKKLEDEGNYKALLDQATAEAESLRTYKERAEALDAMIRQGNEALINRLPEDKRGLVPTEYPPEKLRAWLDTNMPHLVKPPAPDFDAGAGAAGGSSKADTVEVTEADRRQAEIARAQGYNIKPEDIAKRRKLVH